MILALQVLILLALLALTALLLHRSGPRFALAESAAQRSIAVATAGAILGAPFWWFGVPSSFAWLLPPLAFRFLGAAALAFAATGLTILWRPSPARICLYLGMVALYLAPVVAAVLLLHRDRLDWQTPIAWAFLAVAGGLAISSTIALLGAPTPPGGTPPGPTERRIWSTFGLLFALWALALYAWPAAPFPPLFLWATDPLSARLIAVMPATLALMAWGARNRQDLGRPAAIGYATYGFWVVIACLLHGLAGRPLPWLYLGALGLGSAWGFARALRR